MKNLIKADDAIGTGLYDNDYDFDVNLSCFQSM